MAILPDWADVLLLMALSASVLLNLYQLFRLRWYKYDNENENVRIQLRERKHAAVNRIQKTIRIRQHAGGEMIPSACYVIDGV